MSTSITGIQLYQGLPHRHTQRENEGRFVMFQGSEETGEDQLTHITLVTNGFEELRRKLSTSRD